MSDLFDQAGRMTKGVIACTPKECARLFEKGALYVDIRNAAHTDYKIPDVPDIILLPYEELHEQYRKLPTDRHLILADASGLKSREAVEFLQTKGFDKVAHMAGGFVEWERYGLPIRQDIGQRLTGACVCQLKPRDQSR